MSFEFRSKPEHLGENSVTGRPYKFVQTAPVVRIRTWVSDAIRPEDISLFEIGRFIVVSEVY